MPSKRGSPTRSPSLADVSHVFFDAGGTLLMPDPGPADIFRRALAARGHLIDLETIRRTLRSPDLIVTLIRPLPRSHETEYFRTMNARLVEHLGFEADDAALDDIHASFQREVVWRAYPEALLTLTALRDAGFRLGVISNNSHRLPGMLETAGLAGLLNTVTYSFEVGAEKPHPLIFHAALARGGIPPERALMVGDSYEADYLGARRAGLHALLLCREGEPPEACPTIRTLGELEERLGTRGSRGTKSRAKAF